MGIELRIESEDFRLLENLARLAPDIFAQSVRAALRRAAGQMRTSVRKGMRGASFLKPRDIASAIGHLQVGDSEAVFTVAGAKKAGHKFRLVPNRITARKGMRSKNWPTPGVQIGPGEPVRHPQKAGFSRPFITAAKGEKAYYWREKATGRLKMPGIVTPQYFAAFDRVQEPALAEARANFLKRLEHEIDYRLKLQ